eukprot:347918-Chlamydomonas_euryale.AAC.3
MKHSSFVRKIQDNVHLMVQIVSHVHNKGLVLQHRGTFASVPEMLPAHGSHCGCADAAGHAASIVTATSITMVAALLLLGVPRMRRLHGAGSWVGPACVSKIRVTTRPQNQGLNFLGLAALQAGITTTKVPAGCGSTS